MTCQFNAGKLRNERRKRAQPEFFKRKERKKN